MPDDCQQSLCPHANLQVIFDLAQDTKESRERALQLRALKERQAQDKAQQLKDTYLKKQLSRLAAVKRPAEGGGQGKPQDCAAGDDSSRAAVMQPGS